MTKERLQHTTEGQQTCLCSNMFNINQSGKEPAQKCFPLPSNQVQQEVNSAQTTDSMGPQWRNCFKNLRVDTGKSSLKHSGKRAELELGGTWLSSGSVDLKHLGCLCWTQGYLASPPRAALPVPWGGRGGTQALCQHPGKAGSEGPRANTELPRAPNRITAQDIGTPGETTLLQAQFSLGNIKTRLEGPALQPAHPLPYSRSSCPFDLNSLCKIISANQGIQPPLLHMPGKCPAFSKCHRISRLTINHRNLDPSMLMGWDSLPPPFLLWITASAAHGSSNSQAQSEGENLLFSPFHELFSLH